MTPAQQRAVRTAVEVARMGVISAEHEVEGLVYWTRASAERAERAAAGQAAPTTGVLQATGPALDVAVSRLAGKREAHNQLLILASALGVAIDNEGTTT